MLDVADRPIADHELSLAIDDRRDQRADIVGVVLVVGIGIDDHVGPFGDRTCQAGHERVGKPHVHRQVDDVIDPRGDGAFDGAIAAAVVDDQPLDAIDAGKRARKLRQGLGDRVLLVVAGNLDDEFHGIYQRLKK